MTSRPWHGDMVRISIISSVSVRYLDIVPSEQQHLTSHVTALVCNTACSGARSRQLKGQQSLFKIETVFNIYYVSYYLCRSNKMVAAGSSSVWVCIYCDLKMQRATKQFSLPDEDSQTAPPIRWHCTLELQMNVKWRAFSCLKAPTTAFTFKTLLRHYAKQVLTHSK